MRHLSKALTAAGQSAWVDWKDIAPTAAFMEEIRQAIESADSFVFVISPDSITSRVCGQELEHAAANHKRLIPIVCRPVPDDSVPASIAPLNWISFQDPAAFDTSVGTLTSAVETDLEWVRAHTELLVRAASWEKSGRSRSRTLRGAELAFAESKLVEAADGRKPAPTALQQQFVISSRQSASRTLRMIIAAVSTALVITAVLGVVAFNQYRTAEERARIANSRRLAANARSQLDVQLDLAMLLSAESWHTSQTVEASNVLLLSLQQSPYLRSYCHGHTEAVLSVAFHPNGKILATSGANELIIWELPSCRPVKVIQGAANFKRLAFSPNGSTLGGESWSHTCQFWDTHSWQLMGPELNGFLEGFASEGQALMVFTNGGKFGTVDIRTGRMGKTPLAFPGMLDIDEFAVTPDGALVAQADAVWGVRFFDARTGAALRSPAGIRNPIETTVSMDPKGRFLLEGDFNGGLTFWDVKDRKPWGPKIDAVKGSVRGVAISPTRDIAASAGQDQQVRLWDIASRKQIGGTLSAHRQKVNGVAFSPDGSTVASASDDGEVILWDVIAPQPAGQTFGGNRIITGIDHFGESTTLSKQSTEDQVSLGVIMELLDQSAMGAYFSADGAVLAAVSGRGTVLAWSVPRRKLLLPPLKLFPGFVTSLGLSPDGTILVAGGSETGNANDLQHEKVEIIEVATGQRWMPALRGRQFFGEHLSFTRDGKTLVVVGYNEIHYVDLATRKVFKIDKDSKMSHTRAVAFNPSGRNFVISGVHAGHTEPWLALWDAVQWKRDRALIDQRPEIIALAFSPDGKLMASALEGGSVVVRDGATFEPVARPFQADPDVVRTLAFSRDGKILATGGGSGVQLWDVDNRKPIGLPVVSPVYSIEGKSGTEPLSAVVFSSDRKMLLTSYPFSQTVVHWDLEPEGWISRICAMVNRNLTKVEWGQYMSGAPYHKTCPGNPSGHGLK